MGALDCLRISGPAPTAEETSEAKAAIADGRELLRDEGHHAPSLRDVVWRLLRDAAETLDRLDDQERRWLRSGNGVWWPPLLHSGQELFEAEVFRQTQLRERKLETIVPRYRISDPRAVSRMLVVLDWLRYVRGRNVKRDKMVVLVLATGAGPKGVKRARLVSHDSSDSTVQMIKDKVLRHITGALHGMHIWY